MQPVAFAFFYNMFYKVFRFRPEMHKKIRSASKNTKPYYNSVIYMFFSCRRTPMTINSRAFSFGAIPNPPAKRGKLLREKKPLKYFFAA